MRDMILGTEAVQRLALAAAWVHGILMILLVIGFYSLTEFATQRDLRRPAVRLGLIAYSVGVTAMLGAALIDGFVTARVPVILVKMATDGTLQEPLVSRQVLVLMGVINRALADVGAVAMSLGIAVWSVALLKGIGFERVIAIAGVLIGVLPVAALITGVLFLDRRGILIFGAGQALWNIAVGMLLVRQQTASPAH